MFSPASFSLDDAVMDSLKEMSPSAIDVELRSVAPEVGGNIDMMEMMLDFFKYRLKDGRDYELVQSYIGLFLKVFMMPFSIFTLGSIVKSFLISLNQREIEQGLTVNSHKPIDLMNRSI